MHIVLCLDDKNGLLFNHRRISFDRAVCSRIYERHSGKLMMTHYSVKIFPDMEVVADDLFLHNAETGDTCFVEDLAFVDYLTSVESITVYRWNRQYPSDTRLPQQLLEEWKKIQTTDFAGSSHEIITEEVYVR